MEIKKQELNKKLEYIGLNLKEIPETLKLVENLEFQPNTKIDEKKYKQYKFISPKEIEILLSPTNRLEDIKEKYLRAEPLANYLNPENEEKYDTFLRMLEEINIKDIEKIEESQQEINKKIPFKVRYSGNYLWQIYYAQATDKYFMIVPTEDKDYSTFFYVLKKQIEKKKAGRIFVPICNADYGSELLNKTEIQSLENYLWTFTKDWPSIYEVYDKNDKASLQIIGETEVYGKIKSQYKVKLNNKISSSKFFRLVKALFMIQTEMPGYYKFTTQIDKEGTLEFLYKDNVIEYDQLSDILNEEYEELINKQKIIIDENKDVKVEVEKLKRHIKDLEVEYLSKEKQISTFLECKKTFFGRMKYFFKYSGKKSTLKKEKKDEEQQTVEKIKDIQEIDEKRKKQYTIDEFIEKGKKVYELETELKNNKADMNSLKLKKLNLVKKIENATSYINEIDKHKKSIFEFWKYTNKDAIQELQQAEEEKAYIKTHKKIFDFEEDFYEFGITTDKIQRKLFNKEELDNIYLTTTEQLEPINKLKLDSITMTELEKYLKQIKKDLQNEKGISEEEITDVFENLSEDTRKIKKLANKSHREKSKNKYSILQISKNLKTIEYKAELTEAISIIEKSLEKSRLGQDVIGYKWYAENKYIESDEFNVFNLDAEKEINNAIKESESGKFILYKINFEKGINAISFSNCIYFDNQNKTLPEGMELDTRILVKISDNDIILDNKKIIRIGLLENEKDDNSKLIIKTVYLLEYSIGRSE